MVNGWHWKEKWSETDQEDWTTLIYGEERKLIITVCYKLVVVVYIHVHVAKILLS
jgi:hypothetical protein